MKKNLIFESNEGCLARAMQIIGNKWTALIIEELAEGSRRFCEIERSVSNINPRTLTKRLLYLEEENIITKKNIDSTSQGHCYILTRKGKDLIPVIVSMSNWGKKYN